MLAKRRAILVVEDDPIVRTTVAEVLTDEGYIVHTAANGAEGLEQLRRCRPDLVLLDLMMPVMDGSEFRRRQRMEETLCSIPVLLMTAHESPPDGVCDQPWDGRAGGQLGLVAKPISLDFLLEQVGRALSKEGGS